MRREMKEHHKARKKRFEWGLSKHGRGLGYEWNEWTDEVSEELLCGCWGTCDGHEEMREAPVPLRSGVHEAREGIFGHAHGAYPQSPRCRQGVPPGARLATPHTQHPTLNSSHVLPRQWANGLLPLSDVEKQVLHKRETSGGN